MLINEIKDNFTQIPNSVIIDKNLTDKALRVYLYIASKPTGWNVFNADVQKALEIKQSSTIANIWKLLEELGYISRIKVTTNSQYSKTHKVGSYIYTIYANPNHIMVEPQLGTNHIHNNTNLLNNKETNIIYDNFLQLWNIYAKQNNKPAILKLTTKRKNQIALRSKDFNDFTQVFDGALNRASKSTFINENNFFSFDWLISNDTNIIKVLEDKYKNKEVLYK